MTYATEGLLLGPAPELCHKLEGLVSLLVYLHSSPTSRRRSPRLRLAGQNSIVAVLLVAPRVFLTWPLSSAAQPICLYFPMKTIRITADLSPAWD